MQACTLLQTDNHTCTPALSFFTGRMPFLPPNQQHQSTEGTMAHLFIEVLLKKQTCLLIADFLRLFVEYVAGVNANARP